MFRGVQEEIKTGKVPFLLTNENSFERFRTCSDPFFMWFSPRVPKIYYAWFSSHNLSNTPLKAAVQIQKHTFHSMYDKKSVFWIFLL